MSKNKSYLLPSNNPKKDNAPPIIFLVGFMGSGKSYVGKCLANALNWSFLDLDTWIEEQENKSISSIFAEHGEQYFRERESACLKQVLQFSKTIVATGGGTPCFFDNMDWMNRNGVTIFFNVASSLLVERLFPKIAHRPLLANKSLEELQDFINAFLPQRTPFYERSQLAYQFTTGKEPVVEDLIRFFVRFA